MKCIVTYSSKYGSTQKYAKWIGEALSCEVKQIKNIRSDMLKNYDVIIHGGSLYAGGVSGMKQLVKLYPAIREKKLILFTCGLADPTSAQNVMHIEKGVAKAIPEDMYDNMKQFHFRGGIDYRRLSPIHRMMMWMLCQTMKKKGYSNLSDDDRLMLDTYGKQIDFSDQSTIKILVDYVFLLEKQGDDHLAIDTGR